MTLFSMFALAGAMVLLAINPGPGVFATVSRALGNGFKNASFVVLGIIIADLIYLLSVVFALGFLANFLGDFFIFIEYIAGLLLVYVAYKIFKSKEHNNNIQAVEESSWQKNFLTGLIITLGNPRVILFYISFLPAFINLGSLNIIDIVLLCSIVTIVLSSVLLFYAYKASGSKNLFKNKNKKIKIVDDNTTNVMQNIETSVVIRA